MGDKSPTLLSMLKADKPDWSNPKIMDIIESDVASSMEQGFDGRLPLHHALSKKAPDKISLALLAKSPGAAMKKDGRQLLPLHLAAISDAPVCGLCTLSLAVRDCFQEDRKCDGCSKVAADNPVCCFDRRWSCYFCNFGKCFRCEPEREPVQTSPEMVIALLAASPLAAQERDDTGRLALHRALAEQAPFQVVLALLDAFPQAAKVKDYFGRLPIHYTGNAAVEVVTALLAVYPQGVQMKDNEDNTPIHRALPRKASLEVILAMLAAFPDAASVKNTSYNLPLHLAVANKATVEVVSAVLAAFPKGAKVRGDDSNRWLPLHRALYYRAADNVVDALLIAYPEAIKERDGTRRLPIHLAVSRNSFKVLSELLVAFPQAAKEMNENGDLPLHLVGRTTSVEVVSALLVAFPQAVQEENKQGSLPLHVAARFRCSAESFSALLAAFPQAAREKDKFCDLPIHYAVGNNPAMEVVFALLESFPLSIRERGRDKKLPIHVAAEKNASNEVILELLSNFQQATQVRDSGGCNVLHRAAQGNASFEVISALLLSFPQAAQVKDGSGCLPLHYAGRRGVSALSFSALLTAFPEAAKERDRKGWLPLHSAAANKAAVEVVSILLVAFPGGAQKAEKSGLLPLHLAAANNSSCEVVKVLLNAFPQAAREKNREGKTPLHLAMTKDVSAEVVSALLDAFPPAAREKEKDGNTPLHLAFKTTPEVVVMLLTAFPQALQEKSVSGACPLVMNVWNKASEGVCLALLSAYPQAVLEKDKNGWSPLLAAAHRGGSVGLIAAMLAAFPQAAQQTMKTNGKFPLHYAAESKASAEVVRSLLFAFPEAAQEKDGIKNLPLHLAAGNKSSWEVVSLLLVAFPQAAKERDKNGKLPLLLACTGGASLEVVSALLNVFPEAASMPDGKGTLPIHEAAGQHASLETLSMLLTAFPQAGKEKITYGLSPVHAYLMCGDLLTDLRCCADAFLMLVGVNPGTAQIKVLGMNLLHFSFMSKALPDLFLPLLFSCPLAAQEKSDHGGYPLHYAAMKQGSIEIVAALLTAFPHAVRERGIDDKFPLQLAAELNSSEQVISTLLSAFPEAAQGKDKSGMYPLHWFANEHASVRMFSALLAAFPQAAKEVDSLGKFPLHFAAEKKASAKVCTALLNEFPHAAQGKDANGMLPIHLAVCNNASVEVVSALLTAFPHSAMEKDGLGSLPLHLAAEKKASDDVILELLAAFPSAAQGKDRHSKLPIHHAVASGASEEVVLALLSAFQAGAKEKDGLGRLCIHHAAEMDASLEVAIALLAAFPQSVQEKDRNGKLPIHLAAEKDASFGLVSALLAAFPQSVQEKDQNGRLALHSAAEYQASVEVFSTLLSSFPKASQEKDSAGVLPLHYALKKDFPVAVLIDLALSDLPINLADGTSNLSHCYSWSFLVDHFSKDAVKSKSLVQAIMQRVCHLPGACLALAHAKHENSGNEAIAIAHEEARQVMYSFVFFCGQFELQEGPPVHRSATAVVMFALDHGATKGVSAARFGTPRKVAIKFMRNEDQWQREIDVREKSKLNSRFVISPIFNPPSPEVFSEQVSGIRLHDGSSLADFKYGLVMPAADRSLDDINRKERPGLPHIKTLMLELGNALKHCHENSIIHGDVKLLNALRLDGRILLIDMDASCVFSVDDSEGSDYVGNKFSSGVLPPEMFYQLKAGEEEQYKKYWGDICDSSSTDPSQRDAADLWKKIAPRKVTVKSGRTIKSSAVVVKTFRTMTVPDDVYGGTYQTAITDGLPYASELVRASPTFDIWSFGCIFFRMVTGRSLFAVDDKDDDIQTAEEMFRVLNITDVQIDAEVDKVSIASNEASLVKDLLLKILRVKPSERLQNMGEVLRHSFFAGVGSDELLAFGLSSKLQLSTSRSGSSSSSCTPLSPTVAAFSSTSNPLPHPPLPSGDKCPDVPDLKLSPEKKAADRASRILMQEVIQDMEKAKDICAEDIVQYGLIYQQTQSSEGADLRELETCINSLPCVGKEEAKLRQPTLEDDNTTSAEYMIWLNEMFEDHDETIFTHISSVVADMGYKFVPGKPKAQKRATQKARLVYDSDYSQLKDLRRGSIVCPKVKDIVKVAKRLAADPEIIICRKLNRFAFDYNASDETAGYRDLQLNIEIKGTGLIWELQIHLAAIEERKTKCRDAKDAKGLSGHARYVWFREIVELLKQKRRKMNSLMGGDA